MSRQQIRQYERAQVIPGANIVAGIADVYQVPIDSLFTDAPASVHLSPEEVTKHLQHYGVLKV